MALPSASYANRHSGHNILLPFTENFNLSIDKYAYTQ